MPRLKIKFSDGSGQEISFKGELVGIEVIQEEPKFMINPSMYTPVKININSEIIKTSPLIDYLKPSAANMLGHWKTNEHFHIEIYAIQDNLWLGRCKDCGGGKDKLIYDLNGDPVNYPEFGKLMNRLDMSGP